MSVVLDHLIVAAASLEQGVAWCESTLGVTPGPGGRHALMGTHNRLFKIASPAYPGAYFEIIAIDPEAPPPGRARWFGLDDAGLQAQIAQAPRLIHFVARSTQLDVHRARLIELGHRPGEALAASRETARGTLSWQILVREDGRLSAEGALPTLIQWQGVHPTEHMPDGGVVLTALALRGLGDGAPQLLQLPGVQFLPGAGPALTATLSTPLGEVQLSSPIVRP
jgi:hypothetical protein